MGSGKPHIPDPLDPIKIPGIFQQKKTDKGKQNKTNKQVRSLPASVCLNPNPKGVFSHRTYQRYEPSKMRKSFGLQVPGFETGTKKFSEKKCLLLKAPCFLPIDFTRWFQRCFIYISSTLTWRNNPIWVIYCHCNIFQTGWFNHQLYIPSDGHAPKSTPIPTFQPFLGEKLNGTTMKKRTTILFSNLGWFLRFVIKTRLGIGYLWLYILRTYVYTVYILHV